MKPFPDKPESRKNPFSAAFGKRFPVRKTVPPASRAAPAEDHLNIDERNAGRVRLPPATKTMNTMQIRDTPAGRSERRTPADGTTAGAARTARRRWRSLLAGALAAGALAAGHAGDSSLPRQARPFTLVVLPDTQNYTDSSFGASPTYFYDQTRWIRENKETLNIVMVAHEGDIVQHAPVVAEWRIASDAFTLLDDAVPYILCLGNHDLANDQSPAPDARRTLLNDYFPPARFARNPTTEAHSPARGELGFLDAGRSDNFYRTFKGGGMDFLIIALEFKPRDRVLAWANRVVAEHPRHHCIVLTHGYLDADGSRNLGRYQITGNDSGEIWNKFVKRHANIFLLLCGHRLGEAVLTSVGEAGNPVHQILLDYQNNYLGKGGAGYLRIMIFHPDEGTIQNLTYSPSMRTYLRRPRSQFTLKWAPVPK